MNGRMVTATEQFEDIAIPELDRVYRAAVMLTRDRQQAEDLVQTTYLKALQRFSTFREGTNIKAWLMRILRNTWIDKLRHRKVVGTVLPLEEEYSDESNGEAGYEWTETADLIEKFSDQQVIDALGQLPDDQKLTLLLVDVEQMEHSDVAEIMGVPVGTVKSRTSRSRAALREQLEDHAREYGFIGRR